MSWKCPEDWKYVPDMLPATQNMLFCIMFGDNRRFKHIRNLRFRRCNASGKIIWPLQKAWCGVVAVRHRPYSGLSRNEIKGTYSVAWLNEDQYIVQKLKGNI